jgi:hypothetical protein
MPKVLVTDTNLTNIANAIRSQNGTNTTYKPGEMASAILAIETKEDLSAELSEQEALINNQVIKVAGVRTALQSRIASGEADVEDLTSELSGYSSGLTTQENVIDSILSALENKAGGVDTSVIEDAFILRTVSGSYVNDRVSTVGYGAMANNPITSASFPNATTINQNVFYGCTSLETVSLPNVTSIGNNTFYGCTAINNVYIPLVTYMGSSVFRGCTALEEIEIPLLTTTSTYVFHSCSNLMTADLGALKTVNAYMFTNCSSLDTLILRKTDSICTLHNTTNSLTGTPIASGTGYVYVPDDLVDTYKAATNWSTYADQILPLSYLDDDGGIGGGGMP